jgi:hypothetical protein
MGVNIIRFIVGWHHFSVFGKIVKGKGCARICHLIWLATTWSIWRLGNNIMFRGAYANVSVLVDQIVNIF